MLPKVTTGLMFVAAIGLVVGALPGRAHAIAGPQLVQVTNVPLPVSVQGTASVSGTVGVSGTPSVAAQQSGPWIVGLSDGTSVKVANDAANPVFVHDVGPTLVQGAPATLVVPVDQIGIKAIYSVPDGQRFTLDHISIGSCPIDRPTVNLVALKTDDGSAADFLVPVAGPNCFAANHQTQVVVGQNRVLNLQLTLSGQTFATLVNYSFSGHLDPM